jgi:hypothetical protein
VPVPRDSGGALGSALAGAAAGAQRRPKRRRKATPRRARSQDELRAVSSRSTRARSTPRAKPRPLRAPSRPRVDTDLIELTPAERRLLREQRPSRTVARDGRRVTVDTGLIERGAPARGEARRAAAAQERAKPSFLEALEDEFAGRGAIAAGVEALAESFGEHAFGVSTGAGPGLGTLGQGRKRGSGIAAALGPQQYAVKDAPLLRAGLEDAVNLPKDAVAALYELGAAGVEAGRGDTKRGRRLVAGLD